MYLLLYGVTNVVFVVGLRVNARWVYPLMIFDSGAFSDYQVYRFNHTHSIAMLPLTIFDQKQSQLASLFLVR